MTEARLSRVRALLRHAFRRHRAMSVVVTGACLLGSLAPLASVRADDRLGAWLERRGLDELLAVHLEEQLETTSRDGERQVIVGRLARIYAGLLERDDVDGDRRTELLDRGRRIVDRLDADDGDPLRLTLLQANYAAASRSAELWRLRMVERAEADSARAELERIASQLEQVRERLDRSFANAERRVSGARDVRARVYADQADDIARSLDRARFIEAWARAYVAWLASDRGEATRAQTLFSQLLEIGESNVEPRDVSADLRADRGYAETVLGMAFVKSKTAELPTVLDWLNLIADPVTNEAVRANEPYWRLAILLDRQAWDSALDQLRSLPGDVPPTWLRLAAVSGLDAAGTDARARDVGTAAVAELAARRELAQVLDIASKFDLERLGGDGFALRYVEGVRRYELARERKEAGDLAGARTAFGAARDAFSAALEQPDAANFGDAVEGTRVMLAWCAFETERWTDAQRIFVDAARAGVEPSGDLMWMGIVALDRAFGAETGTERRSELESRLLERIDEYLAGWPTHREVGRAVLRRLALAGGGSIEDARRLLSIPDGASDAERAREQGLQLLYRFFRNAEGEERAAAGLRFLDAVVLEPIDGDAPASDRARGALRLRQVLEVALDPLVSLPEIATEAIGYLARAALERSIDVDAFAGELLFRRLQLAIAEDDLRTATTQLEALEQLESDDVRGSWPTLGARRLLVAARERARLDDPDPAMTPERSIAIETIRRAGRLLTQGEQTELETRELAVLLVVARAEALAFEASGDPAIGRRALELIERVLAVRTNDVDVHRARARVAEALDEDETALASWRVLAAGLPGGSDAWFEARTGVVRLLLGIDRARARAVLEQHVALYPEFGPPPWGAELRSIAASLGMTEAGGAR